MAPRKDTRATKGGVEKKAKKVKDPNAPKRPLSAYFIYANEVRDQVKTDNPGIGFGQVGKKIGAMWGDLTSDEKGPYEAKAKAEKERYEKEKAEYEKKTESA